MEVGRDMLAQGRWFRLVVLCFPFFSLSLSYILPFKAAVYVVGHKEQHAQLL